MQVCAYIQTPQINIILLRADMSLFSCLSAPTIVMKNYLEIDGITIEILRKPIKNLHLRIYPPEGQVRVSAPLKLSMQKIRCAIEAKRAWIHQQRARVQARPINRELRWETGESHDFLGQAYELQVIENTTLSQVVLQDNLLQLWVKTNTTRADKEALVQAWYRAQMASLVPDLIKKWQPIINVTVAQWGIKIMKTRWGSCNVRTHRIWLNLALIKKPISCLESVLVHEMVHLLEPSHNRRFYALMDEFMPTWRVINKNLTTIS